MKQNRTRLKVMVFIARKQNNSYQFLARHNSPSPKHGGSRWYVVTGRIETGESEEQAAQREVREETGIVDTQNITKLPLEIDYNSNKNSEIKYLEQAYLVITEHQKPIVLNEESDDYRWLPLDDFCETIWWSQSKTDLKNILLKALAEIVV